MGGWAACGAKAKKGEREGGRRRERRAVLWPRDCGRGGGGMEVMLCLRIGKDETVFVPHVNLAEKKGNHRKY